MAQIPLTLSNFSNGPGTIATIAKPETISSISELPDLKVMVKEVGGPYKQLYFQLAIRPTAKDLLDPKAGAERLLKSVWQETRSKRFRAIHGECIPAPDQAGKDPHARRLLDSLERLIKHSTMRSMVIVHSGVKEKHHEFALRLPRGVHFRMYHSLIASAVGPSGRQHDGVFAFGNDRYYYYLHRPIHIGWEDIPHKAVVRDVMDAFKEDFPFIDMSQSKMFPNVDLLKVRELERLAKLS